jgi:glutathione synthase/RimK-type ligase-like ATP-grasp enzyme
MNNISNNLTPTSRFLGLAPFLRLSLDDQDLMPIAQSIFQQLEEDSANPELLMNLSMVMQILGDPKVGLELQKQALLLKRTYVIPSVTGKVKYRLLLLMAPGDIAENTPLDCLMEGEEVELIFYYLSDEAPWFIDPIPEHDIAMVGVCESANHKPMLEALTETLKHWQVPVINAPEYIGVTDRTCASRLLNPVPGIEAPMTFLLERASLAELATGANALSEKYEGARFPILLRPRDSHAGRDLEKIESTEALVQYLEKVKTDEYFLCNFIDYSDEQGDFKKFRIVLVEGNAYICHKATSKHWMIHYVNAGMLDEEAEIKRQDEAYSMMHFDEFIKRHGDALKSIYEKTKMDYLGIDCAETKDGQLLIFEIDHVMVVHGMDPVDKFAYKLQPIQKIKDAFNTMVEHKIKAFSSDENNS